MYTRKGLSCYCYDSYYYYCVSKQILSCVHNSSAEASALVTLRSISTEPLLVLVNQTKILITTQLSLFISHSLSQGTDYKKHKETQCFTGKDGFQVGGPDANGVYIIKGKMF